MYLYRWTIEKIEGYPVLNGFKNVIGSVSWEVEVRDTSDHSIHYIRRTTSLDTSSITQESFTDYLELTDEQVLQWVWNIIGKESIENLAKSELDELRAPKTDQLTSLGMPWKGSCCPDGTGITQAFPQ